MLHPLNFYFKLFLLYIFYYNSEFHVMSYNFPSNPRVQILRIRKFYILSFLKIIFSLDSGIASKQEPRFCIFLMLLNVNGYNNVSPCNFILLFYLVPHILRTVFTDVLRSVFPQFQMILISVLPSNKEKVKLDFKFIFKSLNHMLCQTIICSENICIFSCILLMSFSTPNLSLFNGRYSVHVAEPA